MTEPEVPGSDPTTLRTRAVRDGDEWVIDGHKWFSSGAEGAAFGIVMAVTDPDADPHARATQIIVPADTPGVDVVRPIVVMGHAGKGWSTHCEVRYTGVRVPRLEHARRRRSRLPDRPEAPRPGPHPPRDALARSDAARIRADVHLRARPRDLERPALEQADHPELDRRLYAEIQACRLMTLDAAHKIDGGDEARVEVSAIKFFAAKVLVDVIDRAVQVHGARGLTDETPLAAC